MKFATHFKIERASGSGEDRYDPDYCLLDMTEDSKLPVLVATDGRMLAVIPVETEDGDETGGIPIRALLAARELSESGAHECRVSPELVSLADPTDTRFPGWRKVIPELGPDSVSVIVDVYRLMNIARAIGANKEIPLIKLRFEPVESGTKPILISRHSEPDAIGVLMTAREV